jgi:hypothetical protein
VRVYTCMMHCRACSDPRQRVQHYSSQKRQRCARTTMPMFSTTTTTTMSTTRPALRRNHTHAVPRIAQRRRGACAMRLRTPTSAKCVVWRVLSCASHAREILWIERASLNTDVDCVQVVTTPAAPTDVRRALRRAASVNIIEVCCE